VEDASIAWGKALALVQGIAANITDADLRSVFLNSRAVQYVTGANCSHSDTDLGS